MTKCQDREALFNFYRISCTSRAHSPYEWMWECDSSKRGYRDDPNELNVRYLRPIGYLDRYIRSWSSFVVSSPSDTNLLRRTTGWVRWRNIIDRRFRWLSFYIRAFPILRCFRYFLGFRCYCCYCCCYYGRLYRILRFRTLRSIAELDNGRL